jgi:tetratricopeptide (TPR) repeat protein
VQAVLALLAPRRAAGSGEVEVARRDVPANGLAFEKFLRGMELARDLEAAPQALVFFNEAVDADPLFAPAWAALGRCRRVVGKFFDGSSSAVREAEDAFRRALALSPDLPMAHRWLTHLEAEQGRADIAVARLLAHAKVNRNDALLFAGLVHACRYAGLVEASLAAHAEARRLDPTVLTSVEYTYAQAGDAERLRAILVPEAGAGRIEALFPLLGIAGADPAALAAWARLDLARLAPAYQLTLTAMHAAATRPADEALPLLDRVLTAYNDPEAFFLVACAQARLGAVERAATVIAEVVRGGFVPAAVLAQSPVLDAVRAAPGWPAVEAEARRRHALAAAIFERGNGRELLGLPALAAR